MRDRTFLQRTRVNRRVGLYANWRELTRIQTSFASIREIRVKNSASRTEYAPDAGLRAEHTIPHLCVTLAPDECVDWTWSGNEVIGYTIRKKTKDRLEACPTL